jgi:hypothetical protein
MGSPYVFSVVAHKQQPKKENPFPMRRAKRTLSRRVNGNLHVEFTDHHLTSHSGLEVFGRYLRYLGFNSWLRATFRGLRIRGDYDLVSLVRLFLALMWTGGRRLRHVRFLQRDPMVKRFSGLSALPDERTLSRWLRQFTRKKLQALCQLNLQLVVRRVQELALKTLTMDLDGTVISTGLSVEGARRGYNPHHRKVPSYYPITAPMAQTGQIAAIKNRPGNVHDGADALSFLRDLIRDLRRYLGSRIHLEWRMDGAFFQAKILKLLLRTGCDFAVKVPMWKWLGVKNEIQMRQRWKRVRRDISAFDMILAIPQWDLELRIVCYRRKVFHPTAKNFQLDLFDPSDGTYEYSAVATSKNISLRRLWDFMAGRGAQEKTLAELKDGLPLATVPTRSYGANSAWQLLTILAHNLHRDLQLSRIEGRRRRGWKKTFLIPMESIKSARFEWLNVAGRLLSLAQGKTLRLPNTPEIKHRWSNMLPDPVAVLPD